MSIRLPLIASLLIIVSGILNSIEFEYLSSGLDVTRGFPEIGFGIVILIGAIRLYYRADNMLWIALIIAFLVASIGSYLSTIGMILGIIGMILIIQQRFRR